MRQILCMEYTKDFDLICKTTFVESENYQWKI